MPQSSHENGRIPLCLLWCVSIFDDWLNCLLHMLHLNGFLSLWIILCFSKSDFLRNFELHRLHWNTLSFLWTTPTSKFFEANVTLMWFLWKCLHCFRTIFFGLSFIFCWDIELSLITPEVLFYTIVIRP